jgi:hypothetical protein
MPDDGEAGLARATDATSGGFTLSALDSTDH